jgi:hypothetical protein
MCRRISCNSCGKPTFKGCGDHVEQVLGGIPLDERCRCRDESAQTAAPQATQEANAA